MANRNNLVEVYNDASYFSVHCTETCSMKVLVKVLLNLLAHYYLVFYVLIIILKKLEAQI